MRCVPRSSLVVFALALCLVATETIVSAKTTKAYVLPADVTLGHPRAWGYQRVYPLLDGLFQDVASTQLSQLTLNPNAANAANLNAVQNAFQLGLSFSQTTGAANAAAQQVNGTVTSNAAVQSQLLTLQGQLVQSALTAQQQVGAAQALADQLAASPSATADQQAAAAAALKTATDNLASVTSQLTLVKNQMASSFGSLQTFTPPSTTPQANAPTLPASLLNLTSPPNSPSTPSFPSSKQMDNQINLLWERLSRLVSTLAQPDSMQEYGIDLVEINVGLTPLDRKKQLFGVEYQLGCSSGTGDAVVLDMFPSASAVNIVDTKYRENRVGLAAFLSWFSVGINASYNRDHLQMSQALGQSAYITGYGIGAPKFGWIFGKNLGDDTITPGSRTVFVLVAAPKSCTAMSVTATRGGWFKTGDDIWQKSAERTFATPVAYSYDVASGEEVAAGAGASTVRPNTINSLTYVPSDYDPTGATKSLVSVAIGTSRPIDQQLTISVNGKILKRSRDNFGRGVGSGGAGGLLETAGLDSNSWIPTSSKALTLTLDPSGFGRHFPDIQIAAPSGTFSLNAQLKPGGAIISVSGHRFDCQSSCASDLPALGYPKLAARQLLVSQWHKSSDSLLITLSGDQAQNPAPSAANGGVPTLQVLSGSDQPSWGGDSIVMGTFGETVYRLTCSPAASRLICAPPKITGVANPFDTAFNLEVTDLDHAGSGIKAWQSVEACDPAGVSAPSCRPPLVWQLGVPRWQTAKNRTLSIVLHLDLINVDKGDTVTLLGGVSNNLEIAGATCDDLQRNVCPIDLVISEADLPNISDLMVLQFRSRTGPTASLRNLRSNVQPVVTGINDAQTIMTGQNLFFNELRVGDSGPVLNITHASDGSECRVSPYPAKAEGYLYFLSGNGTPVQAVQVKAGVATQLHHDLSAKKEEAAKVTPTAKPTDKKPAGLQGLLNDIENTKDYGKALQAVQ